MVADFSAPPRWPFLPGQRGGGTSLPEVIHVLPSWCTRAPEELVQSRCPRWCPGRGGPLQAVVSDPCFRPPGDPVTTSPLQRCHLASGCGVLCSVGVEFRGPRRSTRAAFSVQPRFPDLPAEAALEGNGSQAPGLQSQLLPRDFPCDLGPGSAPRPQFPTERVAGALLGGGPAGDERAAHGRVCPEPGLPRDRARWTRSGPSSWQRSWRWR